jgi:radical SAM superfamily enzyme YgiQ (UPF0313 family)
MAGLPTETDEDTAEIVKLALKCYEQAAGKARLSVNIAPFVPKAGTPFQRNGMADISTLEKRLQIITSGVKGTGIEVKSESPAWSHVQGALSRGDARIAEALACIETNSLAGWRRAVKRAGLDLSHYVTSDWDNHQLLPWAMAEMA